MPRSAQMTHPMGIQLSCFELVSRARRDVVNLLALRARGSVPEVPCGSRGDETAGASPHGALPEENSVRSP